VYGGQVPLMLVGVTVEDHHAWEVVVRKRRVRSWVRIFMVGSE
jgi:hypothetical protein